MKEKKMREEQLEKKERVEISDQDLEQASGGLQIFDTCPNTFNWNICRGMGVNPCTHLKAEHKGVVRENACYSYDDWSFTCMKDNNNFKDYQVKVTRYQMRS